MSTRAKNRRPGAVTGVGSAPDFLLRGDVALRVAGFAAWSSRLLVCLVDRDLVIRETSAGFRRVMGLTCDPAGRRLAEFLHGRDGGEPAFALSRQAELPLPNLLHSAVAGCSFACCVYALDDGFLLVAEPQTISDLEMVDSISQLTEKLGNVVRQARRRNNALRDANERATLLMHTDPLTGLGNRRYFETRLEEAISHAHRHREPLALVMADLDHFKLINDSFGHDAGDNVIEIFADVLRKLTRLEDVLARFGGEEFLMLLPHTDGERAAAFAERVRAATQESLPLGPAHPVTVSLGVAELLEEDSMEGLMRRVDEALYEAKAEGRNRVSLSTPPRERGGAALLL